jgi:anti-sigma B factor antagonist
VTFTASVLYDGDVCLLVLAGELDVATTGQLERTVAGVLADGLRTVVVDLTDLDFCDSTGLGALLRASRAVTAVGGRAVLAGATGPVERLFSLTAVELIAATAPEVRAALAELEPVPRVP